MGSTSIGRGPASGGNENHDADPMHTTMGEEVKQEPPAGNRNELDEAAPVPGKTTEPARVSPERKR
ncbi:MAG: hypothetical protein Q8R01_02800 [Ramlibacter sp.]|nr:hypothetical protein [Ramlibacter sp.]